MCGETASVRRVTRTRLHPPTEQLLVRLTDKTKEVPDRLEKLRVGVDRDDVAVWNKGSVLFVTRLNSIAAVFLSAEEKDEWAEIAELYRKRKQHTYRDAPNRHSNHNGKRSYWAIGFNSLDAMVEAVSAEEWKEYCAVHTDCCGLSVKRTKR